MAKAIVAAIGIDFGSSLSRIAAAKRGGVDILLNDVGNS